MDNGTDGTVAVWKRPTPRTEGFARVIASYIGDRGLDIDVERTTAFFARAASVESAPGDDNEIQLVRSLAENDEGVNALLAAARRAYLRRGQRFAAFVGRQPSLRVIVDPGTTDWTDLDEAVAAFMQERFVELGYDLARDEIEAMIIALADSTEGTAVLDDPDSLLWVAWMAIRSNEGPAVQIRRALATYTPGGRDILIKAKLFVY